MSRFVALLLALFALTAGPAGGQSAAGPPARSCRIGVNIEDLYDFNLASDTFGVVLWLWSFCPSRDPRSLETIVFRTAMPGLQLGDVRSTPVDQGGLYQYRRVQGTFRHDWDMRRYPFDRHQLVIPFDESDLGAAVVIFEADAESSFLSPEIAPSFRSGRSPTSSFRRASARRLRPMVCPTPRRSVCAPGRHRPPRADAAPGLLQADRRRLRGSADRRFDLLFRSARSGIVQQQARPAGWRAVCGADQHAQFRRHDRGRQPAHARYRNPSGRAGADRRDRIAGAARSAARRSRLAGAVPELALLAATAGSYIAINVGLIAHAAWG